MPAKHLSPRLQLLADLIVEDLSNKQIASRMGIGLKSITPYKLRLAHELGFPSVRDGLRRELQKRARIDYMRLKAIELNEWLKQHGDSIPEAAKRDMQRIMAGMVNEAVHAAKCG